MRYYNIYMLALMLLTIQLSVAQKKDFQVVSKNFLDTYSSLQIPNLHVNYVQHLKSIKSIKDISKQEDFFKAIEQELSDVDFNSLDEYQRLDYCIMNYEIALNLERISLEKNWNYNSRLDDSKSIYSIKNGKGWYAYLLKRWVNDDVNPNDIFQFGLEEIEKVKTEMKKLQEESGLSEEIFNVHLKDSSFFYYNVKDVEKAFNYIKKEVAKSTPNIFPYVKEILEVNIAQGSNASLAHAPAYYNNSTFFFNFFDKPFNKRQIDWIYIHEGIPGHHYQITVNNMVKRTEIQQLFWYPGFIEGWGAYVEYLGKEMGVYKSIYDEYGKWEWDLIRSVRVALDVGINYYGWSDDIAISFWKKHIFDQDDIGWREIGRMKRWPAQVVTYKYGADTFLTLLNESKKNKNFDYMTFHKKLLEYGDIPIAVFKRINNN